MGSQTGTMLSTVKEQKSQREAEMQSGLEKVNTMLSQHKECSQSLLSEVQNLLVVLFMCLVHQNILKDKKNVNIQKELFC